MSDREWRTTRRAALLGAAAVLFSAGGAQAQWWRRARDIFEDLTGRTLDESGLSEADAAAGAREALRVGATRTIERVGRLDGYFADPAIHIPLPGFLGEAQSFLSPVGLSGLFDDLELKLNRGAEMAAPQAKDIFFDAIGAMTFSDAMEIVRGADDAATRYFEERMTPRLRAAFRPVIEAQLDEAGAMAALDGVSARLDQLPVAPQLGAGARTRLVDHGLTYALAGMFHYLAQEEKEIRDNPARRSSEILRKAFG